ncbi:DNA ligase [Paenibacillus hemerocallicola]|uniref:DNA ligase (ATP) n=1 Tax=Paenibacillus hemerocallicola TaxID=1172614 RepID=A0A5C4TCJ5_9BACL|nr:RNA ligase family protein [Paenibacillus hemerocallicola]TNJ66783.1 DNA ligase [Paenibacillus hemerocallicola]
MDLKPIIPFEPVRTDKVPAGPNWVSQIKWDGVRMLTYFDGTDTRLWNRRRNDRTQQYPEFLDVRAYCRARSVILDGEMIALDGRKPSFHEIMKRDRLRTESKIAQAVARVPVTYMIFDIVYCDGEWVNGKPLAERQSILERMIVPGDRVQIVPNVADGNALLGVMRSHSMEGIVCKDLTSAYAMDGKDGRWQKLKLFHDLYAVVGGVTFRDKIVNALLLGLYDDDGTFLYIGHAGTGKVTQAEWERLTRLAGQMRVKDRPFRNEFERSKDAVWIRPELVVKVQFLEWTPDGVLRHPSIQSFAEVDNPISVCTFRQS